MKRSIQILVPLALLGLVTLMAASGSEFNLARGIVVVLNVIEDAMRWMAAAADRVTEIVKARETWWAIVLFWMGIWFMCMVGLIVLSICLLFLDDEAGVILFLVGSLIFTGLMVIAIVVNLAVHEREKREIQSYSISEHHDRDSAPADDGRADSECR